MLITTIVVALLLRMMINTLHKSKITENGDDGWILIGKLQQIYRYSSSGDKIIHSDNAICKKFGLHYDYSAKSQSFANRKFITYSLDESDEAHEVVSIIPIFNAMEIIFTEDELIFRINDTTLITKSLDDIEKTPITVVNIQHFEEVSVHDCGDEVANFITTYFVCDGNLVRLGVVAHLKKSLEKILSNLSTYTLINENKVETLKEKTGKWFLTPNHFSPNLVITGNDLYCEENMVSLKIGEAEFHKIDPYDVNTKNFDEDEEKSSLIEAVCSFFDDISGDELQNVGVTMKMLKMGKIFIGQNVFAKYHFRNYWYYKKDQLEFL